MQFASKLERGRRMQITGPHLFDGHRHPWLHREINSKSESPYNEPKNRRLFPRLIIPESARRQSLSQGKSQSGFNE